MTIKWATVPMILTTACVIACSSAESDWHKASLENSIAGYQAYAQQHAAGQHMADAQAQIAKLQEGKDWSTANMENTPASYQQYLSSHAEGEHAAAAKDKLTGLARAAAWQTAKSAGTVAALQDFLKTYPSGDEAQAAQQKLGQLMTYRVQLAMTGSEKAADTTRAALQKRFQKLLPEMTVVAPTATEKSYAVVSSSMSEENAEKACGELKHAHQNCEVVNQS